MLLYKVFDCGLNSNVALPELIVAEEAEPLYVFNLHAAQPQEPVTNHWSRHVHLHDGREWLSLARQRHGFLLRFHGWADFLISTGGREIDCYPRTGTDLVTLSHLLLDQVIPMVLSQRGELVLHAGAVASREGAIVFLGETGLGKSTLSASFCQQGFALLTDDCLLLRREGQEFRIIPSYPGLRLWSETRVALSWDTVENAPVAQYSGKERIKLNRDHLLFCTTPVHVNRLYILAPPTEETGIERVHICPVRPRDAFMELVKSSFRLDTTDHKSNRRTFERIDEAVNALDIFRLSFPRDMSFLPSVRTAVLEHMVGGN